MLKRLWRKLRGANASAGYRIVTAEEAQGITAGWKCDAVARRQAAAFDPLMARLRAGQAREDFRALAEAVAATNMTNPSIVEVGCGSGWNCEVLERLWGAPFRYVGVDYSLAMVALGRAGRFIVGDATRLPVRDGGCDVLVSGTVLMHVLGYRDALRESRRVTHRWCVLHTVPVLQRRETTVLTKLAYGQPTVEIVFNEGELNEMFKESGLVVRRTFDSIPYNLESVLGEATATKTYLCEAQ